MRRHNTRGSPALALVECQRKQHYPDEPTAARDAARILGRSGLRLRPYRCLACKGWCLTRQAAYAYPLPAPAGSGPDTLGDRCPELGKLRDEMVRRRMR